MWRDPLRDAVRAHLQCRVDHDLAARVDGALVRRHERDGEAAEAREEAVGLECLAARERVRGLPVCKGERLWAHHLLVGHDLDALGPHVRRQPLARAAWEAVTERGGRHQAALQRVRRLRYEADLHDRPCST